VRHHRIIRAQHAVQIELELVHQFGQEAQARRAPSAASRRWAS